MGCTRLEFLVYQMELRWFDRARKLVCVAPPHRLSANQGLRSWHPRTEKLTGEDSVELKLLTESTNSFVLTRRDQEAGVEGPGTTTGDQHTTLSNFSSFFQTAVSVPSLQNNAAMLLAHLQKDVPQTIETITHQHSTCQLL